MWRFHRMVGHVGGEKVNINCALGLFNHNYGGGILPNIMQYKTALQSNIMRIKIFFRKIIIESLSKSNIYRIGYINLL